ncbi:MAG: hypothetical protein JXR37_25700 [Kiritimatiellae bacterium]|nr:hypothetical protein [Kiritimatiellia bacterium]
MRTTVRKEKVLKRLNEQRLEHRVLPLSEHAFVVCLQRGGRILGPFWDEAPESELWLNRALKSGMAFRRFLDMHEWNIGGDRIWIAPEWEFNASDRLRFFETYDLPPAMDPGNYRLDEEAGVVTLATEFELDAYASARRKALALNKTIRAARNPLWAVRDVGRLASAVRYAGYEQLVTLVDRNPESRVPMELWSLMQLNPGGTVVLPCTENARRTDYFEPVDPAYVRVGKRALEFEIDGTRRYKVGVAAPNVYGRFGYLRRVAKSRWSLIVRAFSCNPSDRYVDGPVATPGHTGDAFHVYNDGGDFGGFGEMECHSETIGGDTGRFRITANFPAWFFRGGKQDILEVARILLG